MFPENINSAKNKGWVEIITGSMFSGKTEELIRRIRRAEIANQKFKLYKPKIENRYSETEIISHDKTSISSNPVENPGEILKDFKNYDVIGIDEAQFFDNTLTHVVNEMADNGIRVIVAGLDMDFKGNPFNPMPQLMAIAEYITKTHAICIKCGDLANYSHRKSDSEELIELGEKENYEPLCRACFNKNKI
jgi:thymidine kinase